MKRTREGKYTFDGNFERPCRCGHTLGNHTAAAPHACLGPDLMGECDCPRFRPVRPARAVQ